MHERFNGYDHRAAGDIITGVKRELSKEIISCKTYLISREYAVSQFM